MRDENEAQTLGGWGDPQHIDRDLLIRRHEMDVVIEHLDHDIVPFEAAVLGMQHHGGTEEDQEQVSHGSHHLVWSVDVVEFTRGRSSRSQMSQSPAGNPVE